MHCSQQTNDVPCVDYTSLLDASIESLSSGLARRKFTSVDLVKVRWLSLAYMCHFLPLKERYF